MEERNRRYGRSKVTGETTGLRGGMAGFGVFPKLAGRWGTAGVVDPSSEKKRYQPTGMRGPGTGTVGTGAGLQTQWSLNSMAMAAGSNIYRFLMP